MAPLVKAEPVCRIKRAAVVPTRKRGAARNRLSCRSIHALLAGIVFSAGMFLVALLPAALFPTSARAQLSPGPLSQAHALLEGVENCTRCHDPGRKLSPARCFACHSSLALQVQGGRGLHARPEYASCEICHADHQGRTNPLVWWGKAGQGAFDHSLTGWKLEGKHSGLSCDRCHREDRVTDAAALKAGAADPARTFLGLRSD